MEGRERTFPVPFAQRLWAVGSQTLAQSEPVSEGFGKLGLIPESISLLTLISSLLKSKPQTGEGAAGTPSLPTSTCPPSIQAELDAEAESVRIHKEEQRPEAVHAFLPAPGTCMGLDRHQVHLEGWLLISCHRS